MRIVDWWIDYYPLVTSNSIEQHRYSRSRQAKYDYAIVSREEWTQRYCGAPCFVVIIVAFLFRPGLLWTSSNIPWSLSRASISKCIAFTAFFRTSYMLHVIHSYNVGHETNSVLSLKYFKNRLECSFATLDIAIGRLWSHRVGLFYSQHCFGDWFKT